MEIRALRSRDVTAAQALLRADAPVNIFPLGVLENLRDQPSPSQIAVYGVFTGVKDTTLAGFAMVTTAGLTIPYMPDPEHATAFGRWLIRRHEVGMLVGPRQESDHLWAAWCEGRRPKLHYEQRLMQADSPPPFAHMPGFRPARTSDAVVLERYGSAMMLEDLGFDPAERNPTGYRRTVMRRIERGLTWVLERNGELCFKIDVGNWSREGVTVGGTYVPPHLRGRGIASQAMGKLLQHLLGQHPLVTLHLNEANSPAMKVYLNAGFRLANPMRLILSW